MPEGDGDGIFVVVELDRPDPWALERAFVVWFAAVVAG